MRKKLEFNASPRPHGNTSYLLEQFRNGAAHHSRHLEVIHPHELNLEHCHGCLRCNLLRRCSISGDDWEQISFRSFHHIQITQSGLTYTPWHERNKDFVLLLSMGSSDDSDADPVIDLFRFVTSIPGPGNHLHIIKATRLAVSKQVIKDQDELRALYEKMKLPAHLAAQD
jgi:hypothetical protein